MRAVPIARLAAAAALAAALGAGGGAARAAEPCPNAAVLAEDAAFLGFDPEAAQPPQCRGYELASPPYKAGFRIEGVFAIAPDGARAIVGSPGAFAGTESDPINHVQVGFVGALYELRRESSGWVATPLDPSAALFPANQVFEGSNDAADGFGVSGDLAQTLWYLHEPEPSQTYSLYLGEAGAPFAKLGPVVPPAVARDEQFSVEGTSRDLSHVVFALAGKYQQASALWPGDTTVVDASLHSLYEQAGTSEPELVGVRNAGPPPWSVGATHLNEGAQLISDCGASLGAVGGSGGNRDNRASYNAVSAGGETVFFTPQPEQAGLCTGPAVAELYARLGGSETVAISEPTPAQCGECITTARGPAEFQGASEDGSKAFFTSGQELLPGAEGGNLYEYDFANPAGEKVLRASTGAPGHETSRPGVGGVLSVSADGSHVYFVAAAKLTGANAAGAEPEEGRRNLYLFERDASYPQGRTAFVATLSAADGEDWGRNNGALVKTSPDGRFLVFSSSAELTPDDTSTVAQLFEYDAGQERLVRVSIGQNGYNGDGNVEAQADVPRLPAGPALSADGADVFFESARGLSPGALDDGVIFEEEGHPRYAQNVYEYRSAVGGGGSIAAGEVALISAGNDLAELGSGQSATRLYGAGLSGADAFFSSGAPLVGQDTDTQIDLYDARAGGGFPQPPALAGCAGEGCLGPISPLPAPAPAASSAFSAPGNPQPHSSCKPAARKAQRLSRRAKKLRRRVRRLGRNGKLGLARKLRRRTRRLVKRAKRQSKSAKRCRQINRGSRR
jgi:hypothetical protein